MKRKKARFYVACEATWDILTCHPTLEAARRALSFLVKHNDMLHEDYIILTNDLDGFLVPIKEIKTNGNT